jgi:hypothetical protein
VTRSFFAAASALVDGPRGPLRQPERAAPGPGGTGDEPTRGHIARNQEAGRNLMRAAANPGAMIRGCCPQIRQGGRDRPDRYPNQTNNVPTFPGIFRLSASPTSPMPPWASLGRTASVATGIGPWCQGHGGHRRLRSQGETGRRLGPTQRQRPGPRPVGRCPGRGRPWTAPARRQPWAFTHSSRDP